MLLIPTLFLMGINIFAQKRNVVLIVADDHGKEAIGCYGNSVIQTPNIDKLAADGMRFTNAFCTSASCSASRSVILTGQFGHAIGHYGHEHSYHHFSTFDNVQSLPVILEKNGYRTARIGKYHVAPEKVYHFQEVFQANCRNPVAMANACESFINNEDGFFLYFCTCDPHRGEGRAEAPYKPDAFGNKPGGYPGIKEMYYAPEKTIVPPFLPEIPQTNAELAQYYQSINRVDLGVGKLIEMLKKAGKYENSLIIYISDNGVAFPGAKTNLYDPGMSLPCIVKMPDGDKNVVRDQMISWVDLTPTILDFMDVNYAPNAFMGQSRIQVFTGNDKKGTDEIYASHVFHEVTMYYPMRVIRTKKYKLIYNIAWRLEYPSASDLYESSAWQGTLDLGLKYYGKRKVQNYLFRPEFELYDLENDPDEVVNLAGKKKYNEVFESLKQKIYDFQKNTRDPWVYKKDYE